jgi:hypothetical protein
VCNLYSITTNQATIIALFRVMDRYGLINEATTSPNLVGAKASRIKPMSLYPSSSACLANA